MPTLALVAILATLAGACGGGGEKSKVEDTLRAVVAAWNEKDIEGFMANYTDRGLEGLFGAPEETAVRLLADVIGETHLSNQEITDVRVSGDTATAEADLGIAMVVHRRGFSFVKEEDGWKIDASQRLAPEIPSDVTAIGLKQREFAFEFDESAITSGDIAFKVENIGRQRHNINLFRVPAELDLTLAEQTVEMLARIEDLGAQDDLDPGQEGNLVLTEALAPGRYVIFCDVVDLVSGKTHGALGMLSEFIIR